MRTVELALRPDETLLIGSWLLRGDSVVGDAICNRIEALLANVLVHVADDPKSGGWESLFRDPLDGRFWERFYPQGEMHGGGPPSLRCLSASDASVKYSLASSPR